MMTADTVQKIADLSHSEKPIDTPDGGKAVFLPTGYQVHKMPPLLAPLTHIQQGVLLHDVGSFIAYVNAYKVENSRIFAEPGFLATGGKPIIKAVLDYHHSTGDTGSTGHPPKPDRISHVAVYSPRYSDEWQKWGQACAEPLSQVDFAELIEECRDDIVNPPAAMLLDVVRAFKAKKNVQFDSLVYQPNNSVKLDYSEHVEKVGPSVSLPEIMKLGLPVYYRGDRYEIDVFVRFKLSGGVQFSLKIDRKDRLEDEAFTKLTDSIATETSVPVHIGRI